MNKKIVISVLASMYFSIPADSCDFTTKSHHYLETLRISSLVENKDDLEKTFPDFKSFEETISFSENLILSEKQFWENCQQNFCNQNKRLNTIVSILQKPEYKLNLSLRFKIFNEANDNLNYQIYQSYGVVLKNLVQYQECMNKHVQGNSSSLNEEQVLRDIIQELTKINQESRQYNRDVRHVMTRSTVPSIDQMLRETVTYAYCDVEYVTDDFFPWLKKSLYSRLDKLKILSQQTQARSRALQAAPQVHPTGTRTRKNKKQKAYQQPSPSSANHKKTETRVQSPVLTSSMMIEAPNLQQDVLQSTKVARDEMDEKAPLPQTASDDALLYQALSPEKQPETANISSSVNVALEEIEEAAPEKEEYDLRPWEKYTKSEKGESPNVENAPTHPEIKRLNLTLDSAHIDTAKALLSMGHEYAEAPVKMSEFISLVEALKGYILPTKKCIHFLAPTLVNSATWASVSMHRLHKDDHAIIPRSTPYWNIAKKLLTKVGLEEYLSQ